MERRRGEAAGGGSPALRAWVLLGTLLVLLLAGAAPASAHAALRASDPEDGSVVRTAPTHITLTFTESVGLLEDSFRIYGPDNRRVNMEEPEHAAGAADTARAALPRGLDEGTYTVAWRVVSADSHPVSGAFTFSVGKPSPTPPAAPQDHAEHPVTKSLYDTGRYLAYIAAALLIGTAAFAALCRPPDTGPLRAPLLFGWWTLLVTTAALLVLRSPYEKGTSPATALDVSAFPDTLSGRPGMALLARVLLLSAAALLLPVLRHRTLRTRVTAGAAFSAGLALTWASAEHASAGIQVPVAMTSSVLHLLAMAAWLGGLTALLLTLHRAKTPPPYDTVARFSCLAFTSVTVLVLTGAYQSWRGLGSWSALTGTAYGRTLAVKLAATVFLLLAAALSRRWTALLARPAVAGERVPALVGASGPPPEPRTTHVTTAPPEAVGPEAVHRRALRRSVLAEVVVAVAVLLVTTVLTGTLPSRAEAEAAKAPAPQVAGLPGAQALTVPYDTGTPGGSGTVQLTMDPGRVGENGLQAVVFGPQGALSFVPELRVTFTLPSKDVGPIDAGLTDRGGYWATNDLTLPLEGAWTMKLTVRVSDIDQVTVERGVRIGR